MRAKTESATWTPDMMASFFIRGKGCRMAYDFKKECKELYLPSKKPGIIMKSISAMSAKSYPKS